MATTWEQDLHEELRLRLRVDQLGESLLDDWERSGSERSLHLGIFVEPFLQYILDGTKSIESRFSKRPIPPFGIARTGDLLVLKESSGPIVGICEIGTVWTYQLKKGDLPELRKRFGAALCAQDPDFWKARAEAQFLTLMRIRRVKRLAPFSIAKQDRRGWVTLRLHSRSLFDE